nr:unnamed protein product [Digitaria exilis]
MMQPLGAKGDGEALVHELAHGDESAPTAEARDKADAGDHEVRRDYGAHGIDGVVLAGAGGEGSAGA